MQLTELIRHPEKMDRDTLYELRSLLALHPYFQTARLLMLQNLYILHDASFDEELRRGAIYITDRKKIFNLVEAAHYKLQKPSSQSIASEEPRPAANRTMTLIDTFLDSIPKDEEEADKKEKRRPTPVDATIDYVAYLLEMEAENISHTATEMPEMPGQNLIDQFLEQEKGRIVLSPLPSEEPDAGEKKIQAVQQPASEEPEEEYFTETLARIYIKQGRYQRALEIIQRLSNSLPQKNAYFDDQIRFLEKLIINSNSNKK